MSDLLPAIDCEAGLCNDTVGRMTTIAVLGSRYPDFSIEQEILDPDFVARYVHVQEGAPFDTRELFTFWPFNQALKHHPVMPLWIASVAGQ